MAIIFVYGTLRRGECNSHYLKNSVFLRTDIVKGFVMADLGQYPMVFETGLGDDTITIEVYEIDDTTLKRIDLLEEYEENNPHSYYLRKEIQSASGISGFIYYGKERDKYRGFGPVPGGDWKKRSHV